MTRETRFFATDDGLRLAYEVAGHGDPAMVFVHGWCCDRSTFARQVALFSGRYRTLSIDLRGHGESTKAPAAAAAAAASAYAIDAMADDVLAATRSAGIDRPVIVGHSLGGLVALACAGRAGPHSVRAAVLINPPLIFDAAVRAWMLRSVAAIEGDGAGAWRRAFAEKLGLPADRAFRSDLMTAIDATPAPIAAATWEAMARHDPEGALAAARAPVLFVHSGGEELRHFAQLASQRGFALGVTVGAGHFNHFEVPDQVNPMIDRFLARL